MRSTKLPKLLVLLGPTASGKTKLAVGLARRFDGEIVSADSRQVYRGMDVGTGKDLAEYGAGKVRKQESKKVGAVPYHLIDVAVPSSQFTVAKYQKQANKAIVDILKRGKLPIICGGTGLYISALVDGLNFAGAKPNLELRRKLAEVSLPQLLKRLEKVDPETFAVIDKKNRVRVVRALEIYYQTGKPKSLITNRTAPAYQFLQIGIAVPRKELKKRITKRLEERLEQGMAKEVRRLHREGASWRRLEAFGLEYRWVSRYLQGEIGYDEMVEKLATEIYRFSKRQMTWFKRDQQIQWVGKPKEAKRLVDDFLA